MTDIQTIVAYTSQMKQYYVESYLRDIQLLKGYFRSKSDVVGLADLRSYELAELKQLVFVTNRKLREEASLKLKQLRDEQREQDLASRPASVQRVINPTSDIFRSKQPLP